MISGRYIDIPNYGPNEEKWLMRGSSSCGRKLVMTPPHLSRLIHS